MPQSLVHNIDRASWVMKEQTPVKAHGLGGRSSSFGEIYGDVFDHHSVVYEYANGVRMYAFCRTQNGCYDECSSTYLWHQGTLLPHAAIPHYEAKPTGNTGGTIPTRYEMEHTGPLCGDPVRQSDQLRRLHGPQHADGHHGPVDLL